MSYDPKFLSKAKVKRQEETVHGTGVIPPIYSRELGLRVWGWCRKITSQKTES